MTRFREKAITAVVCLIFFSAAHAQQANSSETLFSVNKRPVSIAEFVYLYRKNHGHKPEEFTKEKIEAYLDLFINYKLKVEEALFRRMDTTSTFRKEFQTYREELLKPYMPDSKLIDSLVALTYERLREEVNASHILIQVPPDASPEDTLEAYQQILEIRKKALKGEDFGTLAAQYSQEPGAQATKGNLGFFTAMQMVFPFEQAAYLTPVGGISEPVRTQFGYHIVKVLDRKSSRGEVEVSHIMIRTGDKDEHIARNMIFDIYDQLQKGMSWEELSAQYSEDPNSKDKGGRLRPFGVGAMASVPEFQDMAFSLQKPGEISDPVQTQFGWHILRLESRIPLPPFEEMKPSLTQRVARDERVTISKEALRRRMRAEFNYQENPSGVGKALALADSVLNADASSIDAPGDVELFTMQGRSYRLKDFLSFIKRERPALKSSEEILTHYVDRMQNELLEEKVKRESPDYSWLLKEYYEGILLFEIMEEEVWNKAMEDSVGQRSYFEQHASGYNAGERIVGKIFSSQAQGPLEELRDLLTGQGAATKEFLATNRIRQDSGSFERKDRAIFSKIPWSAGLHLTEHNGVNYLIQVQKMLPPGPQSFEEARADVITDYQTFLEDSWISKLKRKFGVKVDKKAKKKALEQLINQNP